MCRWPPPLDVWLVMIVAWVLLAAPGLLRAQDSAADPLEAYLLRLGLADLRVRHLEQVSKEAGGDAKLAAGRKLADAYAERLMAASEDEKAYAALKTRVDKLLAQDPQAKTPALTVMLLQADFQRAESLVNAWLDESGDAAHPPAEATAILTRIVPELAQRVKEINAAADKLMSQEDAVQTDEARRELDQQVYHLQSVAARATYFTGWGHYYLGLTRPSQLANADFTAAKGHFSEVLGVGDEMDYAPVEAESLALESVWRARTAIGLGLAELALGRDQAAAACFRWLDHASAPANLRDEAPYWQLRGLINVRNYAAAADLAQTKIGTFAGPPTPGKNSFCTALIKSGAAQAKAPSPDARQGARRMILLGIAGLARLRQFDTLSQLVASHKLLELPGAQDSFYLTWLSGRAEFFAAEKTKRPEEYRAAAATLEKALAQSDSRQDLYAAGQCRYHLAWCRFRLEEFEAAAQAFREVTPLLKEGDQELAAQANWMEFASWQALAEKKTEPRFAASAVAALESLKRDFPSSEQAAKADIYIARMQRDVVPEKAIESLSRVKPGDAGYLAAQYEIVSLKHRIWKESGGDRAAGDKPALEVITAVDKFLTAAGSSGRADERLRACLVAIEVLSTQETAEEGEIDRYLKKGAAAAAGLAATSALLPEFHYRRLQHAQRTKDETALRDTAEWISDNGAGTPYELPALVIVARHADSAVAAAGDSDKQARQEDAAAIYRRLVALVGDSPQAIASAKNALAASSRLAGYDETLGRWKEAAARLDNIVAAYPSDKKYLRRAGIAHVNAGNHAAALAHWRTLLSGLPAGSDEWLEAKHYQLTCLLATDRAAADKVFKQFKLLYPEVKSAAWKEKFDRLASQFAGAAP
jgi:hypothetical protein